MAHGTILLVDPDEQTAKVARQAIDGAPIELEVLQSGSEALTHLLGFDGHVQPADIAPDLVVMATALSGVTGVDVLAILRAEWRTSHLPVVMLTAPDAIEEQEVCKLLRADEVIAKPACTEEHREVWRRILRRLAL